MNFMTLMTLMTLMTNNSNNSNDYDDLHLKIFRTLNLQETLKCKDFFVSFSFFWKIFTHRGRFFHGKRGGLWPVNTSQSPLKKRSDFVPFMTSKIRRSNYYGSRRQVPAKKLTLSTNGWLRLLLRAFLGLVNYHTNDVGTESILRSTFEKYL